MLYIYTHVYIYAATKYITPKHITFIASFVGPGDLNASGGGFLCSSSSGLPLLLPQTKPPPEADKSPGPPKLAINSYLLGVICLVRPLILLNISYVICFIMTFIWERYKPMNGFIKNIFKKKP